VVLSAVRSAGEALAHGHEVQGMPSPPFSGRSKVVPRTPGALPAAPLAVALPPKSLLFAKLLSLG
jgi:hypothetical protein